MFNPGSNPGRKRPQATLRAPDDRTPPTADTGSEGRHNKTGMRIGVLAPVTHPLPPPGYGPWERVAYDLAEGLVELGHDVTVFAPEGSRTSARLWPTCPAPLEGSLQDPRLTEELHIGQAMQAGTELDLEVMHSHLHVHALPFAPLIPFPMVSTLHGAAWNQAHHPALRFYRQQSFVSISDAERRFLPELNYLATVYNGIALDEFPLQFEKEPYLVFAGRLAPEKAPDLAIAVAHQAGFPLQLVGQLEEKHRDYYESEISPHLNGKIEHLGDVPRETLREVVGRARALVMPLRWDEPFGLVVVEAMALGTPVVAWRRGAMPELINHGGDGFLVDSVEHAVEAVARVGELDPVQVRHGSSRFSRQAMARGYVRVYQEILESRLSHI